MNRRIRLLIEIGVNFGLPWLAYTLAEPRYGELPALIASSLPLTIWSIGELIAHRRIDALSMIVLAGIALSAFGMALGGDARLLLIRESLVSGVIGFAFLVSVFARRPLVFYLARATVRRQSAEESIERFKQWSEAPHARHGLKIMTLVWGAGLTLETGLRTWAAFVWPPARFLAIMPPASYAIAGLLGCWTFWYVRQLKKKSQATGERFTSHTPEAQ